MTDKKIQTIWGAIECFDPILPDRAAAGSLGLIIKFVEEDCVNIYRRQDIFFVAFALLRDKIYGEWYDVCVERARQWVDRGVADAKIIDAMEGNRVAIHRLDQDWKNTSGQYQNSDIVKHIVSWSSELLGLSKEQTVALCLLNGTVVSKEQMGKTLRHLFYTGEVDWNSNGLNQDGVLEDLTSSESMV